MPCSLALSEYLGRMYQQLKTQPLTIIESVAGSEPSLVLLPSHLSALVH
jgi:hypothetical protein